MPRSAPCILVPGNRTLNLLELTALVGLVSVAAGFLGALTGLGGGVVITPAMVLLLGIDLHYAMGATLISVIATSSGAAAAYVREGFSNIRIGMFLEIASTVGAVCGASPGVGANGVAPARSSSATRKARSSDWRPLSRGSHVVV